MLKQLIEFLATGFIFIASYFLYFILAVIATFAIGLPIVFGIKLILQFIEVFFATLLV